MKCEFRELPPPLVESRPVDAEEQVQAIITSFYGGLDVPIALFPSLDDALQYLAFRLGGLRPAPATPLILRRYGGSTGAPLYSNPNALGERLTCDQVCSDEPAVVFEAFRVYTASPSLVECDCTVYSVGLLHAYGVKSSVAWIAGIEGGLRSGRIPGYTGLSRLVQVVRRMRMKNLARLYSASIKPRIIGPFAVFTEPQYARLLRYAHLLDASVYGVRGLMAISLFMEPICYVAGGFEASTERAGEGGSQEA